MFQIKNFLFCSGLRKLEALNQAKNGVHNYFGVFLKMQLSAIFPTRYLKHSKDREIQK